MNHQRSRLTHTEIVEAFPDECRTILPREIKRLRSITKEYYKQRERIFTMPHKDLFEEKFALSWLDILYCVHPQWYTSITPFESLKTLESLQEFINNPPIENSKMFSEQQISQARSIKLESIYSFDLLRRSGHRQTALCPFHTESTGSFIIYSDQSWHCFGCQAHGQNAIDFLMKLDSLSFPQAIERLL